MIRIKNAGMDDVETILALQKKAYQQEARIYNDFLIPPLTQTLEEIEKEFLESTVLKAVLDEKIIGSVRARPDGGTVFVGRLIVDPKFQRQGIGMLLMARIESSFSNTSRFELFTGSKSDGNIRFYERLGYEIFSKKTIHPGLSLVFLGKNI